MRGLRQGDLISPDQFLKVMGAFTALLHYRVNQGPFSYHPKCRSINLTHLIFADDLFVLCGASKDSFHLIKCLLDDFYSYSDLKPNMHKCSVFYAGVLEGDKVVLGGILPIPEAHLPAKYLGVPLPIPEAHLPAKYLGVPLISTRLKAADCLVLKEKILKRIHSWSSRKLAYGEGHN